MVRTYILFLFILQTLPSKGQGIEHEISIEIENYLCSKGIELDSCDYLPLYGELSQWINTPYRYAGKSKKGIDCSGLVKCIYNDIYNLHLFGGSKNIFNQVAAVQEIEDLKEGDLIFFKIKKNQISHIGIFLKKGYFIHSSLKKGVIISNLNEPYYQKYYFSGGRIP
jgi:lipoprotein Spr